MPESLTAMPAIALENVSYIYGKGTPFEVQALKDVSFSVKKGSITGLIGHTGSGKFSLIHHLNGRLKPSSGAVFYDGKDINDSDFSK